jgi:copper homeostasis protein CutC
MTEFEGQVLADLSVLKNQMSQLMGIGQPGRLTQLEERVERHERSMQRMKGLVSAAGGLLTAFHLAIDYFRR